MATAKQQNAKAKRWRVQSISCGCDSKQGLRPYMEDYTCVHARESATWEGPLGGFYAIFDGHDGGATASILAKELAHHVAFALDKDELCRSLADSFVDFDHKVAPLSSSVFLSLSALHFAC